MAGVTGRSGSLLPSDAPARLSPTRGSASSRLAGPITHGRALGSRAGGRGSTAAAAAASSAASTTGTGIDYLDATHGTGCLVCGLDNDHANILLCERCNDEYHTYCLRPALNSVPEGDWFCDLCKPFHLNDIDDGLSEMVTALSPTFTSRFGEIVWAQGGVGFGWWPACIYDPRLTQGGARQLAKKNVGKKHLVYFFECHDAPFAVMGDSKLCQWEEGLMEEYNLGKTARSTGKNRGTIFDRALQAALIEVSKPTDQRMEWNHQNPPLVLSPPRPTAAVLAGRKRASSASGSDIGATATGGFNRKNSRGIIKTASPQGRGRSPNRANAEKFLTFCSKTTESTELYCKVLKWCGGEAKGPSSITTDAGSENTVTTPSHLVMSIGFVSLPSSSRGSATFADIRKTMESELDVSTLSPQWQFYVPKLGPVSAKQEDSRGPVLEFLQSTTTDRRLGDGTIGNPLRIFITPTS
mmetsp:Transcript_26998/g.77871  ORF Transcript_26998/g.77871 Transcript_26998/m.77871 type:complete len:468 (-) Transcript_26998:1237-2640(-)